MSLNLFDTSSEVAGWRLDRMEVFNWGTFNSQVHVMELKGGNALLTGPNGSGKTTWIDAMLTLIVPEKRLRHYNQGSGATRKGNRSEETYVAGRYGESSTEAGASKPLELRDRHETYSVLLGVFRRSEGRALTVFQVRWFGPDGKLRPATFAIAHTDLSIAKDIAPDGAFDTSGKWFHRLRECLNAGASREMLEKFKGPADCADRFRKLTGMRSEESLALFSKLVGAKMLDQWDAFIQQFMLEQRDAAEQVQQLQTQFGNLEATRQAIEMAEAQLERLNRAWEGFQRFESLASGRAEGEADLKCAAAWFHHRKRKLGADQIQALKEAFEATGRKLEVTGKRRAELDLLIAQLLVAIERDDNSRRLAELKRQITEKESQERMRREKEGTVRALLASLDEAVPSDAAAFAALRLRAAERQSALVTQVEALREQERKVKNEQEAKLEELKRLEDEISRLQHSATNIPKEQAAFRKGLAAALGKAEADLPFVGELVRTQPALAERWRPAVERAMRLHALTLLVPEVKGRETADDVLAFARTWNQPGRCAWHLARPVLGLPEHPLMALLEAKPEHPLAAAVWEVLPRWEPAAAGRHPDARSFAEDGAVRSKETDYVWDASVALADRTQDVLGWDNREKIEALRRDRSALQARLHALRTDEQRFQRELSRIEASQGHWFRFLNVIADFVEIDWLTAHKERETLQKDLQALEGQSDSLKELRRQHGQAEAERGALQDAIKKLEKESWNVEQQQKSIQKVLERLEMEQVGEAPEPEVLAAMMGRRGLVWDALGFDDLAPMQLEFQKKLSGELIELRDKQREAEAATGKALERFRHPDQKTLQAFEGWSGSVSQLPVDAGQEDWPLFWEFHRRLMEDDLPRHRERFQEFLGATLTKSVQEFNQFFDRWSRDIESTIGELNTSLAGIPFNKKTNTRVRLRAEKFWIQDVKRFNEMRSAAVPDFARQTAEGEQLRHYQQHLLPLLKALRDSDWQGQVLDVRRWFRYLAEEFDPETGEVKRRQNNMDQLSGGEKAQWTYTLIGAAIAHQFGLNAAAEGLDGNSFRFIAIDEAFKAQDEEKAFYLIDLFRRLHLQLLLVTPSDNIHIVRDAVSHIYYVHRPGEKESMLLRADQLVESGSHG